MSGRTMKYDLAESRLMSGVREGGPTKEGHHHRCRDAAVRPPSAHLEEFAGAPSDRSCIRRLRGPYIHSRYYRLTLREKRLVG